MPIAKEELFTGKTNEYDLLRPAYPDELFEVFKLYTKPNSHVADIGAGTGYLSLPLLERGHIIEAVEPNDDMRNTFLEKGSHECLIVRQGNAQSTTLKDKSVDVITMGNVAHWLDGNPDKLQACLKEFKRVLKCDGKIAIFSLSPSVKNNWISDIFNLAQKYDPSFDIDKIDRTFSDHGFHARNFMSEPLESGYSNFTQQMSQRDFYDFMISHSFCDDRMQDEIDTIFKRYADNKKIDVAFSSSIYIGSLKPS